MGIIARQSIKFSIVSYVFMILSIAATIWLYPRDRTLYGLFSFISNTVILFGPLVILGAVGTALKYFPKDSDNVNWRSTIFYSGLALVLAGGLVLLTLYFLFNPILSKIWSDASSIIDIPTYIPLIFLCIFLNSVSAYLFGFISNYKRITIPNIINSMSRLLMIGVFISIFTDYITVVHGLYCFVVYYVFTIFLYLLYLLKLDRLRRPNFKKIAHFVSRKDVQLYSFFGLLSAIGGNLAFRIDEFMITSMLDVTNNGFYAIASRIGSIIAVPTMALFAIMAPVLSTAMSNKDMTEVQNLYAKGSDVLIIIGALLLSGLSAILIDLIHLMPNNSDLLSTEFILIISLVAAAQFVNMATSTNGHIIAYSKFYRVNLYFIIFLAISNISLNYIFISSYGIIGAAYATFIALLLYNLIKLFYIKWKFGMWPLKLWHLVLLVGALSLGFLLHLLFLDVKLPHILKLLVKGTFVVCIMSTVIYKLNLSNEINNIINKGLTLVKLRK